jgi:hypothetical protein
MQINKLVTAIALACAAASALATVTVNFDSNGEFNGTGWVGKGDVQLVYAWNNKQIQNAVLHNWISFSFNAVDTLVGVCTFTTGEGTPGEQTHNITHTATTGVGDIVVLDSARNNSKGKYGPNTGFALKGFGSTVDTGTIDGDPGLFGHFPPVVGGHCPGPADAVWSSITATASTGGLYVWSQGANPKLLWDAAAPPV